MEPPTEALHLLAQYCLPEGTVHPVLAKLPADIVPPLFKVGGWACKLVRAAQPSKVIRVKVRDDTRGAYLYSLDYAPDEGRPSGRRGSAPAVFAGFDCGSDTVVHLLDVFVEDGAAPAMQCFFFMGVISLATAKYSVVLAHRDGGSWKGRLTPMHTFLTNFSPAVDCEEFVMDGFFAAEKQPVSWGVLCDLMRAIWREVFHNPTREFPRANPSQTSSAGRVTRKTSQPPARTPSRSTGNKSPGRARSRVGSNGKGAGSSRWGADKATPPGATWSGVESSSLETQPEHAAVFEKACELVTKAGKELQEQVQSISTASALFATQHQGFERRMNEVRTIHSFKRPPSHRSVDSCNTLHAV